MLADEVQVENNDLLAKKNKSKLTVSLFPPLALKCSLTRATIARTHHGTIRSRKLLLPRLGLATS